MAKKSAGVGSKARPRPGFLADMILYNGKIITVDPEFSVVQGVAIRDGKFIAVGSDTEVKRYQGTETKMIDLEGKTATPGLIDSHCHPIGVGTNASYPVQLMKVRTYDDILNALNEGVKKVKSGEWFVTAPNWRSFDFRAEDMPPLAVFDEIVPDNPLWLACGVHRGHTNSLGLKLAGITKETPDLPGGTIRRDPKTGDLTGRLEETAQNQLKRLLPSVCDQTTALKTASKYYNSIGVTGIQNDGVTGADLLAYQTLKHSGELTIRCGLSLRIDPTQSDQEIISTVRAIAGGALGGLGDDMVKVGGIKTFNESLYPMPGLAQWPRDRLTNLLLEMSRNKVRFLPHVEAGMCPANLSIFQEVDRKSPIRDLRWGLTHQRWTNEEMIQINKDLGLCVNQDVAFGMLTLTVLEIDRKRAMPPDRVYCPLPLWMKAGIQPALSTDGGGVCTELSLWAAIYCATNRHLFPEFNPEFNITREEALKLATIGGAYRMMMENKTGSIEVGKLADLAVFPVDPLTCTPDELYNMRASMTILGGRIVCKREGC